MEEVFRNTDYARELARSGSDNERIERLEVKGNGQTEIRFSWWKDGKMQMRPLDLPEDELLEMLEKAIARGVFSERFLADLNDLLYRTRRTAKYATD